MHQLFFLHFCKIYLTRLRIESSACLVYSRELWTKLNQTRAMHEDYHFFSSQSEPKNKDHNSITLSYIMNSFELHVTFSGD